MAEAFKDLDPDTMPRSPGITYQQLLDQDSREVPEVLRLQSPKDMGVVEYSVSRYTSKEWHDKEVEHLWKKVWQMACREEEIPLPGDHMRYDIAGMSFIVVRTEAGDIKAFPNACLHRGRMLKEFDGNATELRCAFHGFCWNLDGSLHDIPADWDFPQIDQKLQVFLPGRDNCCLLIILKHGLRISDLNSFNGLLKTCQCVDVIGNNFTCF